MSNYAGEILFEDDTSNAQVLVKHRHNTIATFKYSGITIPGGVTLSDNLDVAGALTVTGEIASPTIQRVTVTISNSEIKNLAATQKELVAAEAGVLHVFEGALLKLNYGSEVLTESTDNMIINYVDASGVAASGSIESTGFIDAAADTYVWVPSVGIAAGTDAQLVNTALVLDNAGDGEFGGNASNDTTITAYVYYRSITV